MNIHVIRDNGNESEFVGHMIVSEANFGCYTLERPDKNNMSGISCIPKGIYDWVKVGATQKIPYPHIAILNVQGRSGVCIHSANYVNQLQGCIAVGSSLKDINNDGLLDTTDSRNTFTKLMAVLPDAGTLTIE